MRQVPRWSPLSVYNMPSDRCPRRLAAFNDQPVSEGVKDGLGCQANALIDRVRISRIVDMTTGISRHSSK